MHAVAGRQSGVQLGGNRPIGIERRLEAPAMDPGDLERAQSLAAVIGEADEAVGHEPEIGNPGDDRINTRAGGASKDVCTVAEWSLARRTHQSQPGRGEAFC